MKIDELDGRMRAFEAVLDPTVLPGVFMVARLDGRNFTRLTKELHPFEAPFDGRFHDYMRKTAEHLMSGCGVKVAYAFTQSDEISLLFGPDEDGFGRKLRKLLSILSGEASAQFSLLLSATAVFDCRISQLPSAELVVYYFRWRAEDAHRNALNAHCYWMLRKQGRDVVQATEALRGLSTSFKNELLFQGGINFNDLPTWQKRGSGLYWQEFERAGENPITLTRHRRIDLFADYQARIEVVYVEPPMAVILAQNKRRERPVPEAVIRGLAARCEPPTSTEAHGLVLHPPRTRP